MKQNILVVDDHRENLIALEAILDGDGRNLIMAQSGNEALSLALKRFCFGSARCADARDGRL